MVSVFVKPKTAYEMRISDWSSDVLFRSTRMDARSASDRPQRLRDPRSPHAEAHHRPRRSVEIPGYAARHPEIDQELPVVSAGLPGGEGIQAVPDDAGSDRKSTRLNSSH